jgi:hypothetical protein
LIKPESAVEAGGVEGVEGVAASLGVGVKAGELVLVCGMVTAGAEGAGASVAVGADVSELAPLEELITDGVAGEALLGNWLPMVTQPTTKPSDNRTIETRATRKILIVFDRECPSFDYFLKPKLIRLS